MKSNSEFLIYCFANSVNPEYKFIRKNNNGSIELFKDRTGDESVELDVRFFNPIIFAGIPVGQRCSLSQVLCGYKIGTSDRSFKFASGVHYIYPYNLFSDIFKDTWDPELLPLVMNLPMTEDRWKGLHYVLDNTLSEREQSAIYYYYNQEDTVTLEEAGKKLGISRERFRQILNKAIRKLRHPTRSIYILKGYEIASGEIRRGIYESRQKEIDHVNELIDDKIEMLKSKLNGPSTELLKSRPKDVSIDDLDLSIRSRNCLLRANIITLEDLSKKTIYDLTRIRNLGHKSLEEIRVKLKNFGIELEQGEMF